MSETYANRLAERERLETERRRAHRAMAKRIAATGGTAREMVARLHAEIDASAAAGAHPEPGAFLDLERELVSAVVERAVARWREVECAGDPENAMVPAEEVEIPRKEIGEALLAARLRRLGYPDVRTDADEGVSVDVGGRRLSVVDCLDCWELSIEGRGAVTALGDHGEAFEAIRRLHHGGLDPATATMAALVREVEEATGRRPLR